VVTDVVQIADVLFPPFGREAVGADAVSLAVFRVQAVEGLVAGVIEIADVRLGLCHVGFGLCHVRFGLWDIRGLDDLDSIAGVAVGFQIAAASGRDEEGREEGEPSDGAVGAPRHHTHV